MSDSEMPTYINIDAEDASLKEEVDALFVQRKQLVINAEDNGDKTALTAIKRLDVKIDDLENKLHELHKLSDRIVVPLTTTMKENLSNVAYLDRETMSDISRRLIGNYIIKNFKNKTQETV